MTALTIVIATTNPGKLGEIRRALADLPLRLITLADLPPVGEPEETGLTFAENALLKARYYSACSGLPTVADDSGLAIDALGGRPGVASARYPGATYAEKFVNVYRELAPHSQPWTARFVCAVALAGPAQGGQALGTWPSALDDPASAQGLGPRASTSHVLFNCEAVVEGEISPEPRGVHGFGYDPIFFYPPYGRTLGEVSDEEKMAVSHRGKAFNELRLWLEARESSPL